MRRVGERGPAVGRSTGGAQTARRGGTEQAAVKRAGRGGSIGRPDVSAPKMLRAPVSPQVPQDRWIRRGALGFCCLGPTSATT